MIGKIIADWLFDKEVKEDIIKKANDAFDVPFINEKTEQKVLYALWKIFEMVFRAKLSKMS